MNWEAFIVIGVLVIALGAILLFPGLYWGRQRARKEKGTPLAGHVTPIGYVYFGASILLFFGGAVALGRFVLSRWPDRPLASLVAIIAYVCTLLFVSHKLELRFRKQGIELVRAPGEARHESRVETSRDS